MDVNKLVRQLASKQSTQGLFLKKDLSDSITPRYSLIEFPNDFEISFPDKSGTYELFEFFNSEHHHLFEKTIHYGGKSLADSLYDKITNFLFRRKEDCNKLVDTVTEHSIFEKWSKRITQTYVSVPVASFSLANVEHFRISAQALKELKLLELKFNRGIDIYHEDCLRFFEKFGSHFYDGVFHIGGVRIESKSSESKTKRESRAGMVNREYIKSKTTNAYERLEGGMSAYTAEWTKELIENPQLWTLFDREMTEYNFHGIWNLILENSSCFDNAEKFGHSMKIAWKSITGLNSDLFAEGLTSLVDDAIKEFEKSFNHEMLRYNRYMNTRNITKLPDEFLVDEKLMFDGRLQFRGRLYVRTQPSETDSLELRAQRKQITKDYTCLLPGYLGFVKGFIDSDDLPANICEDQLKGNIILKEIRTILIKKCFVILDEMAEDKDKFMKFYMCFAANIKEGILEDRVNRNRLAKFLRFYTSLSGNEMISLNDQLCFTKPVFIYTYRDQKKKSLYEVFETHEVIYLTDQTDLDVVQALGVYKGKHFRNVSEICFD